MDSNVRTLMDSTTFSVSFLIRKCKTDKKRAEIYTRIIIDGEEKEFSRLPDGTRHMKE